jgi:Na+-translocating ferredoxin:NAD+ oxidoreductase RnfG subunit
MVKVYLYVGGVEDKIVLMLEVAMGFVLVLFVLLSAFLSTKIYNAVKKRQTQNQNMEKYQIP